MAQPADRVVVYFAGHGFVKDGKGYLAPWDVDPDRLDATAYPMSALGDVLANKVKANWKVLLTDACHSGKINAETTNEALEQQFSALPASFLTLTATTEREQSFEDPNLSTGFGFFTYLPGAGVPRLCRQRSVRRPHHGRRADRVRAHRTCAATRASASSRRRRPPAATTSPTCCSASAQGCSRTARQARRRCSAPPSSNPTWTMSICISTAR